MRSARLCENQTRPTLARRPARLNPVLAGLALLGLALPAAAGEPIPAAIAPNGAPVIEDSFQRFAKDWLDTARREVNAVVRDGVKREPSGQFDFELRATGRPDAPYVALLRYTETIFECEGRDCTATASLPVTEMFRYEEGAWVY